MRIVRVETLIARGRYAESAEWRTTREKILKAIRRVDWPPGSGSFMIHPQSGKKRGEGSGVTALYTTFGAVALEWETGNVSSSHRSLNKMSLGLLKGVLAAGILVVPSRELYKYLTDRIGNFEELAPYLSSCRRR